MITHMVIRIANTGQAKAQMAVLIIGWWFCPGISSFATIMKQIWSKYPNI